MCVHIRGIGAGRCLFFACLNSCALFKHSDKMCGAGMRTFLWTSYAASPWSGYDELDTRLRAKGVQDGPKKKAMRQAVQGLGGKGGPVRGNDGQRPIGGTRHKGFDAEKMGLRMRGDGRRRVPRERLSEDQQGLRDREAREEGRGARARERDTEKFPGLLEPRPCVRFELLEGHRGEIGPIKKACGPMEVSNPVSTSISAGRSPTPR